MRIYVASSWKTNIEPVLSILRNYGHEVYDFKHPNHGFSTFMDKSAPDGFSWGEFDEHWKGWSPENYRMALEHSASRRAFKRDMRHLEGCDALVLVKPCGASAHTEAGYAAGAGKKVVVLLQPENDFPEAAAELMYKMFDAICLNMEEVIEELGGHQDE